jgi:hypothetical protein
MATPVAFVAMKFDKDPWNDKRFGVISDVLEEAGYEVQRGDALLTSAAVMDEVAERLTNADLVVLDTTGDSHNVSYELGYCHGTGRDPSTIILLRRAQAGPSPFNYAHFRFLRYDDLAHLRRLLRFRFQMLTPLTDDQSGFALTFSFANFTGGPAHGASAAEALLGAVERLKFSGRLECYGYNPYWIDRDLYVQGLGFKPAKKQQKLGYKDFENLIQEVSARLQEAGEGLELVQGISEITDMRSIRGDMIFAGAVEFNDGQVARILDPGKTDSWYIGEAIERLRNAESDSAV